MILIYDDLVSNSPQDYVWSMYSKRRLFLADTEILDHLVIVLDFIGSIAAFVSFRTHWYVMKINDLGPSIRFPH